MRMACYLFILHTILYSCNMSDQQKNVTAAEEVNQNDCFTDRKDLSIFSDLEGEIFQMDNVNFGIRSMGENEASLLPCNLPQRLQKAGLKIIFSGKVKETRLEELWAGQPFVLTAIREK